MEKRELKIPAYIQKKLNKAFTGFKTDTYQNIHEEGFQNRNFFVIWDDDANKWLAENLPVYSSGNDLIALGNSYVVIWNWNVQRWYISV